MHYMAVYKRYSEKMSNNVENTFSELYFYLSAGRFNINKGEASNQRRPKTKKHAFLRATSKGNRDFYVRMGL